MCLINKEFEICVFLPDPSQDHFNLDVRPSWINPGFKGLFAKQNIIEGQTICKYRGQVLTTQEALRTVDKSYLMRIGSQIYVDARNSPDCLAR